MRLPGATSDIRDLYRVVRNDPIDNTVSILRYQEGSVPFKGIEHSWTHEREFTQEFQLVDDLVLDRRRQGFEFFDGAGKKFNLSVHASALFWPVVF